jgi:methionyl-tRNA formyltransferase
MTLRVIFFGNSNSVFSLRHFRSLTESNAELVGVVDSPARKRGSTNPLSAGLQGFRDHALANGIPLYEPDRPDEPEFIKAVAGLSPDLFLAVGYTNILRKAILRVPRRLSANFHASLLPAYRGKHPVFWCLRGGERWSGLTVHAMDPGIDTGDILYQVRVRVRKKDTVESLYDRILESSTPLVRRLILDCERGSVTRTPQAVEGASYFSSIGEEDFRIHWEIEAERIRRSITMTPGECFIDLRNQRLSFLDAEVIPREGEGPPGTVFRIGRSRGTICATDGGLLIRQVRLGDGPAAYFAACLQALGFREGDNLEN